MKVKVLKKKVKRTININITHKMKNEFFINLVFINLVLISVTVVIYIMKKYLYKKK